MKANTWKTILQIAISILTAIATTLGVTSSWDKKQNDRSPQYEESGHFRSTENSGHEGSKSLRVIIIFQSPQKGPVIKVTVIKVIKDFGFSKIPQYPSIL